MPGRHSCKHALPFIASALGWAASACGGGGGGRALPEARAEIATPPEPGAGGAPTSSERCVVHLHGRAARGATTHVEGGITHLHPDGNEKFEQGFQWMYFPDGGYEEVHAIVKRALDRAGCRRAILHGFSNGGAAAAKLFCRGEDFGGRVVGYIVDDPVPDHGVDPCSPPARVKLRVYWTGKLAMARAGFDCSERSWTCEGGSTLGIDDYAERLGAPVTRSVHEQHRKYEAPPEYAAWF